MGNSWNIYDGSAYRDAGESIADGWGSVWDWLSGKTASEINYESSAKLMQLQNQFNQANWRTTQVDGPSLYREGLEKAGYNPILAVTGGSSVPTGSIAPVSSSPSSAARGGSIGDIMSMFSWVTAALKVVSEIGVLQQQASNVKADTELKQMSVPKLQADMANTAAKTAQTIADTQEPGHLGQAGRAIKTWFRGSRDRDVQNGLTLGNLWNYVKQSVDRATSNTSAFSVHQQYDDNNPPSSSRSGTDRSPTIPKRMQREMNSYKPKKSNRRHN